MKINANSFFLQRREQFFSKANSDSKPLSAITSGNPSESGEEDRINKVRSRLKIYMEEIKTLQQQLCRLQEHEMTLKKSQEKLLRIRENLCNDSADKSENYPEQSIDNISENILQVKNSQENIKSAITEKLIARENISASLTVIREKEYAEKIMEKVRDTITANAGLSLLGQTQLQRENIYGLLG